MKERQKGLGLSQPAKYTIKVAGHLDPRRASWFPALALTNERGEKGTPITVLKGVVQDQAMLHGLLARIRDLGLPLLSVERTREE